MCNKKMPQFAVIMLTVALAGCYRVVVGDGMFRVSGDLSLKTAEECEIRIKVKNDDLVQEFNVRQISGNFEEDFTVSPLPEEYTVNVLCNSELVASENVKYPKDMSIGGVVNLGVIE